MYRKKQYSTSQVIDGLHIQYGYAGQREDSHPGRDGEGWCETAITLLRGVRSLKYMNSLCLEFSF